MSSKLFFNTVLALALAAFGSAAAEAETPQNTGNNGSQATISENASPFARLTPFYIGSAPKITKVQKVRFKTSAGDIEMEIYPEAAPNAAKRFIDLVKSGFYDGTPIFRVVKTPRPFVAQFGINWRPGHINWRNSNFNDDPSLFRLGEGTLAFAKAGPNTNSTQVFINYGDNDFLREQNFSTFGIITKGLDIARNFKAVGNPSMGLDQQSLWMNGEAYLKSLPAGHQPTMIVKAELISDEDSTSDKTADKADKEKNGKDKKTKKH